MPVTPARLYENAVVRTMDRDAPLTDALLVDNGRIAAIGEDARSRAGKAETVDLGGRVVVPGMIDAHTHVETAAVSTAGWLDVRAVSNEVLLERVRARAASLPDGAWIVGQATFTQSHTLPGRRELDAVAPRNPVVLRASMHVFAANTLAMDRAGILAMPVAPPGLTFFRDDDGELTGHLREAFHLFPIDPTPPEVVAGYIETELQDRFTRYGVTSVYEVPMSKEGMRAFQILHRQERLRSRVALFPAVRPGLQPLVDDIAQIVEMGLESGFGDDRLWFGGLKYFLDGVYDDSYQPERDIDRPSTWGSVTHLYSEVVRALALAYQSNLQLWFHAIGVGAQRLVIDAARHARRLPGVDRDIRMRIEHAFNENPPTRDMLDGIRAENLIAVPTTGVLHVYNDTVGSFPYRTLIEEGLRPPGNSDNSGTQPFASNPWWAMSKLRTRRGLTGASVAPQESIGVTDAVRAYTEFGAYAGHREDRIGVIRAGALADFAALTADPWSVDDEAFAGIESDLTVVGGRHEWDRL